MSCIRVTFENNIIEIVKESEQGEIVETMSVSLEELNYGYTLSTGIRVEKEDFYQIYLNQEIKEGHFLCVYSKKKDIKIQYASKNKVILRLFKRFVHFRKAYFTEDELIMELSCAVTNPFRLKMTNFGVVFDKQVVVPIDMPMVNRKFTDKDKKNPNFKKIIRVKLDDLLYEGVILNQYINIQCNIEGSLCEYHIDKISEKIEKKHNKLYYVPFCTTYHGDFALHVRRNYRGVVVLVRRHKYDIEKNWFFRFMESEKVSCFLYKYGQRYKKKHPDKKINVFYEKFAEKAEEGAYDVFLEALKHNQSRSYFVIDKNSEDYQKIRYQKNVIKKYSIKYYFALYMASAFISTDSPSHMNLVRSNNTYIRKITSSIKFIFLQHGITYMKCHDKNSPYLLNKESEPDYMFVGSEKEQKVCQEMLQLPKDRLLVTGLPIFSKIQYKHINQNSKDIAVVMLTWKPYEEHLSNFEESSYYRNTVKIAEILQECLGEKNVIIIAHPKIAYLLKGKPLEERLWNKPISEALKVGKLLITDYSSVCYNSFYQGAGVVFFQEDLDYYEKKNGKLIPKADEYVGRRIFTFEQLEQCIHEGVYDNTIHLDYFRNEEDEKRYLTINEFTDGKNVERICERLIELKIM